MQARNDWETYSQTIRSHIYRSLGGLAANAADQHIDPTNNEDELISWLSEVMLMNRVPFHYLVPAERFLPTNSVRFFYVNPNWQQALIDGACSLGRNATTDLSHDVQLIEAVFASIGKRMKAVRPLLQRKTVVPDELEQGVEVIGGFVLRSPLVRGWRGLEFQAFPEHGDQPLRALRIELLSDEVLVALFEGVPYKVEIAQPPEGFYFGFNHINGSYYKRLRSFETGELLAETDTVEVVVHDEKLRTIDVRATANNIATFFNKEQLTSAEFALQMIKTPYIGRIVREDRKETN